LNQIQDDGAVLNISSGPISAIGDLVHFLFGWRSVDRTGTSGWIKSNMAASGFFENFQMAIISLQRAWRNKENNARGEHIRLATI